MHPVARSVSCVFLLLFTAPAIAQEGHYGTFIGVVVDVTTQKPIADVIVTATSPSLKGEQIVATDAKGHYRISNLPTGEYTLRYERERYETYERSAIPLRTRHTLRVSVKMLPTKMGSSTLRTGLPPRIDTNATTSGVNVDQGFLKRITVARTSGQTRASRSLEERDPAELDSDGVNINGPPASILPSKPVPTPPSAPRNVPSVAEPSHPKTEVSPFHMYFQGYGVNPTINTKEERFSNFPIDIDSASYSLTRTYLERGRLPNEQAVRVEEFVNTFDYGYTNQGTEPFSVHMEGFPSPVRKGYHVLRIGVKAREFGRSERLRSNLVFVIDVSDSMGQENRLDLVKRTLSLLANELGPNDRVSIVVYGSSARTVLEPTNVTYKHYLRDAIYSLRTEGKTNVQAGLTLGYSLAASRLLKGGINRVILCSDGVDNTDITDEDSIWAHIRERAAEGITLTTVGFGIGNSNDVLMERLSHVGKGHYAYVDRLDEAHRFFTRDLIDSLQVVAKDVKLQLEFDPAVVSHYRLLGYENRMLTQEQFTDDRVATGLVGSDHAVTALYEVKLTDFASFFGTLRIRYTPPLGRFSFLIEKPLPSAVLRPAYGRAAPPTRLSYVAAAFAEKLRGSYWVRPLTYDALSSLWEEIGQPLKNRADVAELGALIQKARALDHREDRFEAFAPVSTMDFDRVPTLP
ncbi:YfbK domain-containing protein [Myxococcus sp. Y35]|uniref:YfbK domain-containing protein n=1 Tax=Pseudomyxococcus flavus TaxID=3115648 RepID=UPI003CFB68AE